MQSIKEYQGNQRNKSDGIVTAINRMDKPLPIEMDRFWSSTENKVLLQQFFIKWLSEPTKIENQYTWEALTWIIYQPV